ncbi:MAG: LbtU family siderophore porin [Deltaproteobacteria bacterium]|nr:LbtU family siderophore porin [Deltaproteobacteria bacterium]
MYLKTLKALLLGLCIAAAAMISWAPNSLAAEGDLEQQVKELIKQNQALTDRLMQVEQQLSEMKVKTAPTGIEQELVQQNRALYERVNQLEGRLIQEKPAWGTGFLSDLENRITLNGLLEFGGAYQSIDRKKEGYEQDSDICMTTVQLGIAAEINDWVNAEMVLLYEDATFGDETSVDIDEAFITLGNTEKFPLFLKGGKMYVPYGALLEHFPDDPLIDAPLTLCMGETLEKAALIGAEYEGFTVSAYAFNGDVEEAGGGGDNVVESYGFDANYAFEDEDMGLDFLVGGSYISNVFEADVLTDGLDDLGVDLADYVGAAAAYFHVGYLGLFFDAEYMGATDNAELCDKKGLVPEINVENMEVWNFEIGYNYNWWRNLEIALKYAGSNDCDYFGFPRDRYGINFNQEIFDNTILSVGYIYDEYDDNDADDRDTRDLVFGQIAIEF